MMESPAFSAAGIPKCMVLYDFTPNKCWGQKIKNKPKIKNTATTVTIIFDV